MRLTDVYLKITHLQDTFMNIIKRIIKYFKWLEFQTLEIINGYGLKCMSGITN